MTLGIVLTVSSGVFAWWNGGMGHMGMGPSATVDTDALKKFQKETLSLRDELTVKQAELHNEYAKPAPDAGRVTTLQKEVYDLQTRLNAAAGKYGVTHGYHMCGMGACPMMGGGTQGHGAMMGHGGMNHGTTGHGMGMRCW